nr:hypothetical protein [Nostoc sp. KVJ3]
MIQVLPKLLTFTEFIEWYPNDGKRYELHKVSSLFANFPIYTYYPNRQLILIFCFYE